MANLTSFENFKTYFDRKVSSVEFHRERHKSFKEPFITISREAGIGDVSLRSKLIDYLNKTDINKPKDWTLFDKNILEKVASDFSLTREIERFIPENRTSEFQGILEQLFGLHPSIQTIVHEISITILRLAALGNVVIVGRGANIITRNISNGFHIRLIASHEKRLHQIRNEMGLDKSEAAKYLEKEEKGRREYIKKNFNKDIEDPGLYSLILNLDKVNADDAVKMIACIISGIRN